MRVTSNLRQCRHRWWRNIVRHRLGEDECGSCPLRVHVPRLAICDCLCLLVGRFGLCPECRSLIECLVRHDETLLGERDVVPLSVLLGICLKTHCHCLALVGCGGELSCTLLPHQCSCHITTHR